MYCGKCGTNNPEGAEFCKECGASLNGKAAPSKPALNLRTLGIAAVAIIAVIAIAMCIGSAGNSKADAVAVRMVEAVFEPNSQAIFDLMPKTVLVEVMEKDRLGDEMLNYTCQSLDEKLERTCAPFKDMKATCKAVDHRNISGTELEKIVDDYRSYDLKVTGACQVTVEVIVTASVGTTTSSFDIPLIQIGNKWYLDYINMGDLLY